jgi:hypothetical protein
MRLTRNLVIDGRWRVFIGIEERTPHIDWDRSAVVTMLDGCELLRLCKQLFCRQKKSCTSISEMLGVQIRR